MSIPSPDAPCLHTLGQPLQRHIPHRIDAVVVLILRLVRHIAVTILVPLVRPHIRYDTHAASCHMQAVTPKYIKTADDAVRTLRAGTHPQTLRLKLPDALRLRTVGHYLVIPRHPAVIRLACDVGVREIRAVYPLIYPQIAMSHHHMLQCRRVICETEVKTIA